MLTYPDQNPNIYVNPRRVQNAHVVIERLAVWAYFYKKRCQIIAY